MFEHTVVAAHFSSATERLLTSLQDLRDRGTRELTLVDVLRSHHSEAHSPEHRDEARRRLEEEQTELERAGFKVNIELRTGQPAHELSSIARERNAGLILVGSRGEQYVREFFRGSTVLQLSRKTNVPLLIEPIESDQRRVQGRGLDNILLATDFSTFSGAAERAALTLAERAKKLTLLHVLEADKYEDIGERPALEQAQRRLEELAARAPALGEGNVRVRTGKGTASREIRRIAEEEGASLIVLGKRGESPVQELMLGSTTQAVLRKAEQSVLMVPLRLGKL